MKLCFVCLTLSFALFACTRDIQSERDPIGVETVSPVEDLMREHGALDRILLIYEEFIRRVDAELPFPPDVLKKSAGLMRNFIEKYHEKLEEDYLFTRFEKSEQMGTLVKTLKEQHQQGRMLTEYILSHSGDEATQQIQLRIALCEFIAMYRPHAAREDTVLFPAFKMLISESEYDALGDIFERKEEELFGQNGFTNVVGEIEKIEKELGIYTLAEFTPQIKG